MFSGTKALQVYFACVCTVLVAGCGEYLVAQLPGYFVGYWTEPQEQPLVVTAYQDSEGRTNITPVVAAAEHHRVKTGGWQIQIASTSLHSEGGPFYTVNAEGRAGLLHLHPYTGDIAIPAGSELTELSRVF